MHNVQEACCISEASYSLYKVHLPSLSVSFLPVRWQRAQIRVQRVGPIPSVEIAWGRSHTW